MTYDEYLLMTAQTEIDLPTYKAMLKDAASSQSRLSAILEMFSALNVPVNADGDINEIWDTGVTEIQSGNHGTDMMTYAPMIWAMLPSLAESVYNVLDQMFEV